jgi:hypothetical protein
VIERYCLKPAIWSRTVRPSGVGAEIHQKAEITTGSARSGKTSGRYQPLLSAAPKIGIPSEKTMASAAKLTRVSRHLPAADS